MRFSARSGTWRPSIGGQIDPTDLDEYIRHDGFKALRHCLERALAGRDHRTGAARPVFAAAAAPVFPPAQKWAATPQPAAAGDDKKYVICNGDEGDPGAFMDRMLLESFPYRIIEGMAIAAKAVGADEGILYIRAEYPLGGSADPRGSAQAAKTVACWAIAC